MEHFRIFEKLVDRSGNESVEMTRRAEILLASKNNYGGRALGPSTGRLKFEFSDI